MAARKRTYMEVHEALDVDSGAEGTAGAGRGKWVYDDTIGAWLLSQNQLPYVPVERIELNQEIPKPVQNSAKADQNGNALTDYKIGLFRLSRPVRFNRLQIRITSFTAPADGRLILFQEPTGVLSNSVPQLDFFDFTPSVGLQTLVVAPNGGASLVLVRGWFWLGWGQRAGAGSFTLRCWDTQSIDLMNTLASLNAGDAATQFVSNLAASTTPATLNPVVGGDVSSNSSSALPLVRMLTV